MKKNYHFTMLEILTAIALTMVIGWMVSLAFNNTQVVSRNVTAALELEAQGNAIMSAIATELQNQSQWLFIDNRVGGPTGYNDTPNRFLHLNPHSPYQRVDTWANSIKDPTNSNLDYRNDLKCSIWLFSDNFTKDYYTGTKSIYPNTDNAYGSGLPRLMNRLEGDNNANAYNLNFTRKYQFTMHNITGKWMLNNNMPWLAASYNIRDFKVCRGGGTHSVLLPNASYNGSSNNYYTISFFMTNAPLRVQDEPPADMIWDLADPNIANNWGNNNIPEAEVRVRAKRAILTPRQVAEIKNPEKQKYHREISNQYVWVYIQRTIPAR